MKQCSCGATLGKHAGFCAFAGQPVRRSSKQRRRDREHHDTYRKLREWASRPVQ